MVAKTAKTAKSAKAAASRSRFTRVAIWTAVTLGLLATGAFYAPWDKLHGQSLAELFPVGAVRVGGEMRNVTESELANAIAAHIQGGFFDIDVEAVREATEAMAWVSHASVRRVWPDSLQLGIIEHQAAAVWRDGGLLNTQGLVFLAPVDSAPNDLPVLGGPSGTASLVLSRYRELVTALGPVLGRPNKLTLSEQDIWRAQFPGPIDLVFASGQWTELRAFSEIYDSLLKPFSADLTRIDLRYPNGFAVRWKGDVPPLVAMQHHREGPAGRLASPLDLGTQFVDLGSTR
ncbi:MAG: FtsQ-type POTRA domain-containing protein [Gammaproteobacteria bacterium]|nr:FtsQ-type POTRA domain-containing protein [Gammaproteobacteria bacterium]